MKNKTRKPNNKKGIPAIVIIAGIFCPIVFLLYFLARYNSDFSQTARSIKRESPYISVNSGEFSPLTTSISTNTLVNSNDPKFIFTDGWGNLCESGGVFYDWGGNYIRWGDCFTDHRGNLVEWGNPFYDNRDNYVGWGNPFYDAGDNYINPQG